MTDPALLRNYPGLPEGVSVHRDLYSARPVRFYVIRDSDRRVEVVEVDPDDYMVKWEPPPAPPWWSWLNPLGHALDTIDRNRLISQMHGKKVVDWDAFSDELRDRGMAAVQRLLEAETKREEQAR